MDSVAKATKSQGEQRKLNETASQPKPASGLKIRKILKIDEINQKFLNKKINDQLIRYSDARCHPQSASPDRSSSAQRLSNSGSR